MMLPISIIVSVFLGVSINTVLYKIFRKNWLAYLLSVLCVPVVGEILRIIVNSMLPKGAVSIGMALAAGIGGAICIFIGLVCYILTSSGVFFYRRFTTPTA